MYHWHWQSKLDPDSFFLKLLENMVFQAILQAVYDLHSEFNKIQQEKSNLAGYWIKHNIRVFLYKVHNLSSRPVMWRK